jgi:hypothetical protein
VPSRMASLLEWIATHYISNSELEIGTLLNSTLKIQSVTIPIHREQSATIIKQFGHTCERPSTPLTARASELAFLRPGPDFFFGAARFASACGTAAASAAAAISEATSD